MTTSPEARTRLADRVFISHEPLAFRELCLRAVPVETRLLVLDLDRTLHLGRNMGELLGWEISAYRGHGPGYLTDLEPRRGRGRFALDPRRPLATLRYLVRSGMAWAPPGLFYFLWCKLPARIEALRRRSYRLFGPEPVQAVQRTPQLTLFRQMSALPRPLVRELAARVWRRYGPDQTIEREDLAWLRARCPGLRIVLSSASPRAVVETAAAALGVEEVIASDLHRINGGRRKLDELRARFPALGTPGFVSVGISDTGYGEDHCWTEAFTHVVDVNSSAPFPPIAPAGSPLQSIASVPLLTRAEKEAQARGGRWLDPRRGRRAVGGPREFRGPELEELLAPLRAGLERLTAELEARRRQVAGALDRLHGEGAALDRTLEQLAADLDGKEAAAGARETRRRIARTVGARRAVERRLARAALPVSELAFAVARAQERSRELLERHRAARP